MQWMTVVRWHDVKPHYLLSMLFVFPRVNRCYVYEFDLFQRFKNLEGFHTQPYFNICENCCHLFFLQGKGKKKKEKRKKKKKKTDNNKIFSLSIPVLMLLRLAVGRMTYPVYPFT